MGTDYAADLVVIQDAVDDGTYSQEEAAAARLKALADDYETQTPEPRLCYQLGGTRQVVLEDDLGQKQEVSMPRATSSTLTSPMTSTSPARCCSITRT